jgi:hypothetical protein
MIGRRWGGSIGSASDEKDVGLVLDVLLMPDEGDERFPIDAWHAGRDAVGGNLMDEPSDAARITRGEACSPLV